MGPSISGYHIVLEERRLSVDQGKLLLYEFARHGFESLYGAILHAAEMRLGAIPIRPLIEMSGPEVFASRDRESIIICKMPSGFDRMLVERGTFVEFVIVSNTDDTSALDSLRATCNGVLGATLWKGLFAERYANALLDDTASNLSPNGKLLVNETIRTHCRALYETFGRSDSVRNDRDVLNETLDEGFDRLPSGLWLESLVADVLVAAVGTVRAGVQIGIDECDVIVAPFGRQTLVECKHSRLGLNDIATAKARAQRVGVDVLLFVITNGELHPNVKKSIHVWGQDELLVKMDRMAPLPEASVIVVESEQQLREMISAFVHHIKLDLLQQWLLAEDSWPLIPWFHLQDGSSEPVVYWQDWYGNPAN